MNKMSRENAKKIEFYGNTLDQCVEALLKYQRRGESVVVSFNGHDLYSCDVTMDSAYKEVLGLTKAEFNRKREEWRKEDKEAQERKKAKVQEQIPYWLEKGSNLIYPERAEEWKQCVEARASDLYQGWDLNAAIEIMEMLENGATIDDAKEALDNQDHSGASYGMVRSIVFSFSKKGPEFYEATAVMGLSEEERKMIEEKKEENKKIEEGTFERKLTYEEEAKIAESRIQEWIEKGEAIIAPSKKEAWRKHVEAKARGLFNGMSLDEEIELMERLRNGESFESLTELIQNDENRVYMGAVFGVLEFSEFGPDFTEYFEKAIGEYDAKMALKIENVRKKNNEQDLVSPKEDAEIEEDKFAKQKVTATELNEYMGTIDNCVKVLSQYRARGKNVYVEFNGHRIYSCDVTLEGAYKEILGMTKEEFERKRAERIEKYEREQREEADKAQATIPEWISKGEAIIYPERAEEWQKCVKARAKDLYHGRDLDSAIAIMEMLENGATLDEAKNALDEQDLSGASYGMIRNIIFSFSKQGPEFYEHTAMEDLSPETQQIIEQKKRENRQLKELHGVDSTKKVSEERKQEEREVLSGVEEKYKLNQEIARIQQELEVLKEQGAALKKAIETNKAKLNGLDEK